MRYKYFPFSLYDTPEYGSTDCDNIIYYIRRYFIQCLDKYGFVVVNDYYDKNDFMYVISEGALQNINRKYVILTNTYQKEIWPLYRDISYMLHREDGPALANRNKTYFFYYNNLAKDEEEFYNTVWRKEIELKLFFI